MVTKKGDVSISFIILISIAVIVLVVVLALVVQKFSLFNRTTNTCDTPAICKGQYIQSGVGVASLPSALASTEVGANGPGSASKPTAECDVNFETRRPGSFIAPNQRQDIPASDLIRCSVCCTPS